MRTAAWPEDWSKQAEQDDKAENECGVREVKGKYCIKNKGVV
jgi:hypothetical protein